MKKLIAVTMTMMLFTELCSSSFLQADSDVYADGKVRGNGELLSHGNSFYRPSSEFFYLHADWLYWKPVMTSLDWVIERNDIASPVIGITSQQCIQKTVSLPYSSGFRVGAGYMLSESFSSSISRPLQIEATYERLTSKKNARLHSNGITSVSATQDPKNPNELNYTITKQEVLLPSLIMDRTNDFIYSLANTELYLNYNRADIKVAWPMWVNDKIIFRLAAGANFGYFNSSWSANYIMQPYVQNFSFNGEELDFERNFAYQQTYLQWNWWGGGPLVFGDVNIDFVRGFGFNASSSLSFLFGEMNTQEKGLMYTSSTSINSVNSKNHFYSYQPVFDFYAGLNYKHWYGKTLIYVSAGWEFNYWFNINQYGYVRKPGTPLLGEYFLSKKSRALYFEGLDMKIGVCF